VALSGNGETHRVLVSIDDPPRLRLIWLKPPKSGVSGDVESAVTRINAQPMDVDGPGIRQRISRERLIPAPARSEPEAKYGEDGNESASTRKHLMPQ
jgi:hypothetical protein